MWFYWFNLNVYCYGQTGSHPEEKLPSKLGHLFSMQKQGQWVPLSHLELYVSFKFSSLKIDESHEACQVQYSSRFSQKCYRWNQRERGGVELNSAQQQLMCSVQFIHQPFKWFLCLFTLFCGSLHPCHSAIVTASLFSFSKRYWNTHFDQAFQNFLFESSSSCQFCFCPPLTEIFSSLLHVK